MSLRSALVTLKQYKFEIGLGALAALAAAVLGVAIDLRLDALGASQQCLDAVNETRDGGGIADECLALMRAGSEILGETYLNAGGALQMSIMGLLPFVVGLFGGLPIVSREIEDRTAQTAWWLSGSRNRWLIRQLVPIVLILGVAIFLAALAAIPVADDWTDWYGGERSKVIGTYGYFTVLRAFGAFGLGSAVGALLGRTFPAFVSSAALLLIAMVIIGQARELWYAQLPLEPLWRQSTTTGQWHPIGGVPRAVGWGAPDGSVITAEEARQRATDAGVPPAGPDDPQDATASTWLAEHGFTELTLGVSDEAAAKWGPYDAAAFAVLGATGLLMTFVIVNRRRPA